VRFQPISAQYICPRIKLDSCSIRQAGMEDGGGEPSPAKSRYRKVENADFFLPGTTLFNAMLAMKEHISCPDAKSDESQTNS
jgi:hypothetical protein